jgi:hypothetical protein
MVVLIMGVTLDDDNAIVWSFRAIEEYQQTVTVVIAIETLRDAPSMMTMPLFKGRVQESKCGHS